MYANGINSQCGALQMSITGNFSSIIMILTDVAFHVVYFVKPIEGLILQCTVPFRADWAHWYDSLTPTFIMVFTERFEFPLLPGNWLLNILATWKAMDCIHGCYIKDESDYGIPQKMEISMIDRY